jgi:hypothetical protein
VGVLKHLAWKYFQAGSVVLSFGNYNKCPVCKGDVYDPNTKELENAAAFLYRKHPPMCLVSNVLPFVELELVKHRRYPRQDEIERALNIRNSTDET